MTIFLDHFVTPVNLLSSDVAEVQKWKGPSFDLDLGFCHGKGQGT